MTLGPVLAAVGAWWLSRVDAGASYVVDVLAPVLLFGVGLTLLVAPLTATVLDAADRRHAGVASGINNAIARTAGLIAVAAIPVAVGIGGADYADPIAFDTGYERAMVVNAALLLGGAALALLFIRRPLALGDDLAAGEPAERLAIEECPHCGVNGPQLHPMEQAHPVDK